MSGVAPRGESYIQESLGCWLSILVELEVIVSLFKQDEVLLLKVYIEKHYSLAIITSFKPSRVRCPTKYSSGPKGNQPVFYLPSSARTSA